LDGVLVVDKPAGPTSHDVVDRVRRALGTRRVGHTGTLDPFATGVLPVCVGRATRLARFLSGGEKRYLATVRLGFATTTDDATGEPLGEPRPADVGDEALGAALAALVGSFDQVPPAFSARHVGGRRLYELARRGEMAPRSATPVTVHGIDLLAREGETLEIAVRCSPGTYVRAIARDVGERLGTRAHLTALRRTRSGSFDLSQAVSGDDSRSGRLPAVGALPTCRLRGSGKEALVSHGRSCDRGRRRGFRRARSSA
jgi:tRNA pseudouridine55 synthase